MLAHCHRVLRQKVCPTTEASAGQAHARSERSIGKETMNASENTFKVTEHMEGGFNARAFGHSIFTEGDDWDDLKAMVRDAVLCHFDGEDTLKVIRLHLVTDEARFAGKPTHEDRETIFG